MRQSSHRRRDEHIFLTAPVWAEDEGTVTSLEGRVIKYNKTVEPPGEARRDWEMICELARRLGKEVFLMPRAVSGAARVWLRAANVIRIKARA